MEILHNPEKGGYPVEYLLSRIMGRRAHLIDDWESVVLAPDPVEYLSSRRYGDLKLGETTDRVRGYFQKELRWVYLQMNTGLRASFRPFFLHSELGNLFLSLRHKGGGQGSRIEEDLALSLLSERLKRVLRDGRDVLHCIAGVEGAFMSLSWRFKGLGEAFTKEGLRGFERRLTNSCLEFAISAKLHPALRGFFSYLIDSRNITALYKHLRWNITGYPYFIRGGSVNESSLRGIFDKGGIPGLFPLLHRLTHTDTEHTAETGVENILLKGLTRKLRRIGRESPVGLILDYLWRCHTEARNLSVIVHGKDIDRGTISGELVE